MLRVNLCTALAISAKRSGRRLADFMERFEVVETEEQRGRQVRTQ